MGFCQDRVRRLIDSFELRSFGSLSSFVYAGNAINPRNATFHPRDPKNRLRSPHYGYVDGMGRGGFKIIINHRARNSQSGLGETIASNQRSESVARSFDGDLPCQWESEIGDVAVFACVSQGC